MLKIQSFSQTHIRFSSKIQKFLIDLFVFMILDFMVGIR